LSKQPAGKKSWKPLEGLSARRLGPGNSVRLPHLAARMICTPPGNMRVRTRKKSRTPAPARKLRIRIGHNPFEGHALHLVAKLLFGNAGFETPFPDTRETEFPGVRSQTGVWERGNCIPG